MPNPGNKSITTNPLPVDDIAGDSRWLSQHNRFMDQSRHNGADILFIGDSLIQQLQHTQIWTELFVPLNCVNFGIGGDTTQNLLWRIADKEIDDLKPKVIVLLIGTNNFLNTAEEVTEGIVEIVRLLQEKKPNAKIVLIELLPRGERQNRLREKHKIINDSLREYFKSSRNIRVVNLDFGFVDSNGLIHHEDMYDYLHLTHAAYKKAFEPLYDKLIALLGEVELESAIHKQQSHDSS